MHRPQPGLSIVVCCYNSSSRLPRTLAYLMAQEVTGGWPWEVIVVDNASTDDTAAVARQCWQNHSVPLRIIHQPRPGLKYARELGLLEASYAFVSFVDDDNWLANDWVDNATQFLADHPDAAAVGGLSTPAFERDAPDWFSGCQVLYAISPGDWAAGERTASTPLWGAGLTIRKSAWFDIVSGDDSPFLTIGRLDGSMAGGEDSELCYRLLLAGWKLWYEPRLRFQHYMPQGRLTWSYARRLYQGAGQASAILAPYEAIWSSEDSSVRQTWEWKLLQTMASLLRRPGKTLRAALSKCEGDLEVLDIELTYGRLSRLVRRRSLYYKDKQELTQLVERLRSRGPASPPSAVAEPQHSARF